MGVVGANGAGKSTLVKLVCRLYDPERGRILWNGIDIRTLDVDDYRAGMGAVFQDFMSYDLTVRENVLLGNLRNAPDDARISAALDEVDMRSTVAALPQGLDTLLSRSFRPEVTEEADGEASLKETRATFLSGGQWQRLAIARMLMRADRDLLILDEPSSGLDPRAEYELNATVHERAAGSARLLVSHRLNTLRASDRIVVIDHGVVVEAGTHEELLHAAGGYSSLFRMQGEGYH